MGFLRTLTLTLALATTCFAGWQNVLVKDNCSVATNSCDQAVAQCFTEQTTDDWESFLMGLLGDLDNSLKAVNQAQTIAVVADMDSTSLAADLRMVAAALVADSALTLDAFLGEREQSIQLAITMAGDSSQIADLWKLVHSRSQKLLAAQAASPAMQNLGCSTVQPPLFIDTSLFLSRSDRLVLVSSLPQTGAAESSNAVGLTHYTGFAASLDLAKVWQNYDWWSLPGVTTGDSSSCLDLWSIGHAQGSNAVLGINSINTVGTMLKSIHVLQGKAIFLGSDISMSGKAWTTVAQLPMTNQDLPVVSSDLAGLLVKTPIRCAGVRKEFIS